MWRLNVALALAVAFLGEAIGELSCQIPSKWVRVMHLQDLSPNMAPHLAAMTTGSSPVISAFDTWIKGIFTSGVSQGIMSFTQKQNTTGDASDICATTNLDLSTSSPLSTYQSLSITGSDHTTRSLGDVLYRATQINWNSPFGGGRRVVIAYVGGYVEAYTGPLPPFDHSLNCEAVGLPTTADVVAALNSAFITLILVVPASEVLRYQNLVDAAYPSGVVIPLTTDQEQQLLLLQAALDHIYCGTAVPTIPPAGSTAEVLPSSTAEPSCTEDAILNLVHLQDISWSYTNDLPNMKAKFPDLFSDLQAKFFKSYVGLGSFSDKPVSPFGYYGDYCFREHTPLTEDDAVFTAALDSLKIKSGRDWKESQYDAIWEALHSLSMGWETSDEVDGHQVLRVVMLATDAGPHVAGDRTGVPAASPGASCAATDYPSAAALGTELDGKKVYPIFVVTSDLYNYWVNRAAQVAPNAVVLHLSQPSEDVFAAIETALEDICQTDRRRRRLVVER